MFLQEAHFYFFSCLLSFFFPIFLMDNGIVLHTQPKTYVHTTSQFTIFTISMHQSFYGSREQQILWSGSWIKVFDVNLYMPFRIARVCDVRDAYVRPVSGSRACWSGSKTVRARLVLFWLKLWGAFALQKLLTFSAKNEAVGVVAYNTFWTTGPGRFFVFRVYKKSWTFFVCFSLNFMQPKMRFLSIK